MASKNKLRSWMGLNTSSDFVKDYLVKSNMRAVVYMCAIVIALEIWMIWSLVEYLIGKAQAGEPKDFAWICAHGGWYVMLLATALAVLVFALRYLKGKTRNRGAAKALLGLFSVACIAFGIHYGQNSYAQGEQVLAFVTMTLFVFGLIVWKPILSLPASIATFLGFYLIIDKTIPVTYGTQVNLFTLWISTFVVALSSFMLKTSAAEMDEGLVIANSRLQRMADFDELTQIPNMHSFRQATHAVLEGTDELDCHFTILFFDIENFRSYGEKYGYAKADELLHDFAQGLVKVFENELVARMSDDHFVALAERSIVEERIEAASKVLFELKGDVRMHLKVGAFEPESETASVTASVSKARIACNSIKRRSDVRLRYFDDKLEAETARRTYIINNIKNAVREGWIKVFYQPVVACADGTANLIGYEALARWQDPTYGLLPPFAFIETLEEYREIDLLDRCIIEQVCQQLKAELDQGKNPVPVSLNFSRLDFELYDVCDFLREMSEKYQVPPSLLDVEITESALTEQMGTLQENMRRLRDAGFSLWLDDFGSGYSSLNVLKDFQFDVLKIDMAFLRGFPENPKAATVITSIVDLAKRLNLTTLCEGVETREMYDFLHEVGCDKAQGYYFGRPEPAKQNPTSL